MYYKEILLFIVMLIFILFLGNAIYNYSKTTTSIRTDCIKTDYLVIDSRGHIKPIYDCSSVDIGEK